MKLVSGSALVRFLILIFIILGCANQKQIENNKEIKLTPKEVIDKHSDDLMSIEGVEGLYESADDNGNPIIKIMVSSEDTELLANLPDKLEGYDVEIVVSGKMKPL
jgi:hypothetical protein